MSLSSPRTQSHPATRTPNHLPPYSPNNAGGATEHVSKCAPPSSRLIRHPGCRVRCLRFASPAAYAAWSAQWKPVRTARKGQRCGGAGGVGGGGGLGWGGGLWGGGGLGGRARGHGGGGGGAAVAPPNARGT